MLNLLDYKKIMIIGNNGSGKSYFANNICKKYGFEIIYKNDLIKEMCKKMNINSWHEWYIESFNKDFITTTIKILQNLPKDKDIILDSIHSYDEWIVAKKYLKDVYLALIIAPENISYTIQQIEEMIYFEEQYYDSFVEIVDEELWDAYDENEKLLGFDLKRSQAKSLPDGVYHVIVNVYTMTKDGKLLTTERSRNKTYPLKWEVTGGSILKGETAAEGAVRELYEETGIKISTEDLIVLYSYVDKPKHAIYHSYLNLIEKEVHVTLQEGETMDYMYVPYKEFDELVNSDRFVPSEQRRYKNQAVFTMLSRFIPDSAAST